MLRILALLIGLGGIPAASWADPVRLLVFGDSLTEGYGLATDDGLVPQLQQWLVARGHDVEVINDGASGHQTSDGKKRIASSLERFSPDAVIVELGGNDLISDVDPKVTEANLDSILAQAGTDGRPLLLVGIARPERDRIRRQAWADIWPRLAQKHDALLLENLYGPFFGLTRRQQAKMLQQDRIHASAEGIKLIIESLGPKVEELVHEVEAMKVGTN
ncbi:arylesterase [Paracoccus aestuariivivens]|uniref:Arylesterase n=2 Tax=Paracoccus aestuariivivens TaxID=1820333 RepID=A0A6L6J8R1_9RHOB|nr:arylesterase [Paracoccus aestuariivivens]